VTEERETGRERGEAAGSPTQDHLVALPGGEWTLWRCAFARAAGFPAALALGLAAPDAAAAADRALDAEEETGREKKNAIHAIRRAKTGCANDVAQRLEKAMKVAWKDGVPADTGTAADEDIAKLRGAIARAQAAAAEAAEVFATARQRLGRVAHDLASNPRIREAVTWQNRAAVERGFASLLKSDPNATRSLDRKNEELVASYLFRYATKNDTIGFFGPVGWARFEDTAGRVVVRPGPSLIDQRETYFEQWGIDALANALSKDEAIWPWLAPQRFGFVRLDGSTAHSPLAPATQLSRPQELVLRACDGDAMACALAADLTRAHPQELATESAVYDVLKELVSLKLVAWGLEFRTTWRPEVELRARLERIGDERLRETCLRPLSELEAARTQVAAAAGDADRLASALADLDVTFKRLTDTEATRNAGAMYASRGLVFEDCRRDLDYRIGSTILEEIGPALALVLTSARFLTHAAGKAYDVAFRELHATMAARSGSPSLPFSDFWFRAQRLFHGRKDRPITEVTRSVQEKWSRILDLPAGQRRVELRSADLQAAVSEAFDAPRAGWSAARYHAPDLMIGAASVEAIARGDYFAVLGEVHVARNTFDYGCVVAQRLASEDFGRSVARDIPEPRIFGLPSKDSPRSSTVRGTRAMSTAHDYELEAGFDSSGLPRDRALRLGDLKLELEGERLVVVHQDGHFRVDLLELVGTTALDDVVVNELKFLPDMPHSPRVTIDRVVIMRETWRYTPDDLAFASAPTEEGRFLGARRWARAQGLPRFVFVLSTVEVKPVYLDFDSPVAVNILAKLARRAKEHPSGTAALKVSEMLPAFEDCWLPDAEGNRYTSELRLLAVDPRR
jgi:hypothetical protein